MSKTSPDETGVTRPRRKKRNLKQKLLRLFVIGTVGSLVLFLITILAIRLFLPPERIKEFLVQKVAAEINRQVDVKDVHFNPFRGFELSTIRVSLPTDSTFVDDDFPLRSAFIKKAFVKYKLSKIFKKEIQIQAILIDSLDIDLSLRKIASDSIVEDEPVPITMTLDSLGTLPLTIDLADFSLTDAQFHIDLEDSLTFQSISMDNLTFHLTDLQLPKGKIDVKKSPIHGEISLQCDNSTIFYALKANQGQMQDSLSVSGHLDVQSELALNKPGDLLIHLGMVIKDLEMYSSINPRFFPIQFPFPLSIDVDSEANLENQKGKIDRILLNVGEHPWIQMDGAFDDFLTNPAVKLNVKKSIIPISQILELAEALLPDSLQAPVFLHDDESALTLTESSFQGKIAENFQDSKFELNGLLQLMDFGVTYNHGDVELLNSGLSVSTNIKVNGNKLSSLESTMRAKYDSLSFLLPDSISFYSGGSTFLTHFVLNDRFIPEIASCSFRVKNILGSLLEGNIDASSNSRFEDLSANGTIEFKGLGSEQFPDSPLSTTANFKLDFGLSGLDSIYTHFSVNTDSLLFTILERDETLPPIHFKSSLLASTDSLFQNVNISSIVIGLNDLVSGKASASIRQRGTEEIAFDLSALKLKHHSLRKWMPERIQEQLLDFGITGSTNLTAHLKGRISPDSLFYDVDAELFTDQTSITYPSKYISVDGLNFSTKAHLDSDSGAVADISLEVDSIRTDISEGSVFFNNEFTIRLLSKDFQSVHLEGGRIHLPDLYAAGFFTAVAESLLVNPKFQSKVELYQDATDTLELTRDMLLVGQSKLNLDVNVDTLLADLYLEAKTNELTFLMQDNIKVSGINADIKLNQKYDVVNSVLLGDSLSKIITPSEASVDYMTYRDYYLNTLPNISRVSIENIDVMDYVLENLNFELFIGGGRFEVPSFIGTMYGGNLGGRISVDLAQGELVNATYNITGHLSNVNSALLLPKASGEEKAGIINANVRLFGRGLDPEQGLDMRGYFYVTDVGSKVLYNLLSSVEERQPDTGIGYTKTLINWGFKPQLVIMEVRHGYFYPSIELTQPWYFPAKLSGGRVELARIPIMFFVQSALK